MNFSMFDEKMSLSFTLVHYLMHVVGLRNGRAAGRVGGGVNPPLNLRVWVGGGGWRGGRVNSHLQLSESPILAC